MSKPINHNMRFRVVEMTPEWARELLAKNHPSNRRPKRNKIEQFRTDMQCGQWKLTHQGIAVDEDGWLVDGQNRLTACDEGVIEFPTVLVTGVPRKAIVGADCGAARTAVDAARVFGKAFPKNETAYASATRLMLRGMDNFRPTHQEIINFAQRHKNALDFVFEHMAENIKGITASPVRAAVARAYHGVNNKTRLADFCKALMNGLVNNRDEDGAVIQLRNWLLTTINVGGERRFIYSKTEAAIDAFMKKETPSKLQPSKVELFPLEIDPQTNGHAK